MVVEWMDWPVLPLMIRHLTFGVLLSAPEHRYSIREQLETSKWCLSH